MSQSTFYNQVTGTLGNFAKRHGFSIAVSDDLEDPMGVSIILENDRFIVSAMRERTLMGNEENIWIHRKVRPKPRAPFREYSVGDLSAFIQGETDPYPLRVFADDAKDLLRFEDQCLCVDLLNSENLRIWRVDASRRQFGQKPIRRKS